MKKILSARAALLAPVGKELVPAQITYDDSEAVDDPGSEIRILYDGVEYKGRGSDHLWTDAFADLQINLPDGVVLACCMTCRHGNMCPYGNTQNELFCTRDTIIRSKADVLSLFDSSDPFEERCVAPLGSCDDFAPQSDDSYTYNDFFCRLRNKYGN